MKYCNTCGAEINENAKICVKCGCEVAPSGVPAKKDASSFGFAFLGFLIPIVGLILYLIWKDETPLKAKSCGKGALVGVIVSVVLGIIYGVILGVAVGSMSYYY